MTLRVPVTREHKLKFALTEDPLIHYTQFPLLSTVNSKDKKYKNIKSASECAIKCNNEEKLHCRSFNFCPGQDVCYLSETHLLDSTPGEATGDLVCTHYSSELPNVSILSVENLTVTEGFLTKNNRRLHV